ncbi:hypothetical protein DKK71_07735 [Snodgrassella alvi]|nr:hypothetical protein DKK71_07735 [Snodgrassella alvi]
MNTAEQITALSKSALINKAAIKAALFTTVCLQNNYHYTALDNLLIKSAEKNRIFSNSVIYPISRKI